VLCLNKGKFIIQDSLDGFKKQISFRISVTAIFLCALCMGYTKSGTITVIFNFLSRLLNLNSNFSDEAARALHHAGAVSVIRCIPDSSEDPEVEKHKSSLLKRFQDLRDDVSS
jgi:hypothetical protein